MKTRNPVLPILLIATLLFSAMSWNEASAHVPVAEIQSGIFYVKPGAGGNCGSWTTACDLQTAIFNANAGDQIWVAIGTHKPSTSNR